MSSNYPDGVNEFDPCAPWNQPEDYPRHGNCEHFGMVNVYGKDLNLIYTFDSCTEIDFDDGIYPMDSRDDACDNWKVNNSEWGNL